MSMKNSRYVVSPRKSFGSRKSFSRTLPSSSFGRKSFRRPSFGSSFRRKEPQQLSIYEILDLYDDDDEPNIEKFLIYINDIDTKYPEFERKFVDEEQIKLIIEIFKGKKKMVRSELQKLINSIYTEINTEINKIEADREIISRQQMKKLEQIIDYVYSLRTDNDLYNKFLQSDVVINIKRLFLNKTLSDDKEFKKILEEFDATNNKFMNENDQKLQRQMIKLREIKDYVSELQNTNNNVYNDLINSLEYKGIVQLQLSKGTIVTTDKEFEKLISNFNNFNTQISLLKSAQENITTPINDGKKRKSRLSKKYSKKKKHSDGKKKKSRRSRRKHSKKHSKKW